jgi:hypothetical protein
VFVYVPSLPNVAITVPTAMPVSPSTCAPGDHVEV